MYEIHCYLDDVLNKKHKGDFNVYEYIFDDDQNKIDPDRYCHELYEDLATVFNENINHVNCNIHFKETQNVELIDEKRTYGSDYIGPSWNYARSEFNFSDLEIAQGLKETGFLGGHTLWPRKTNSINNAKGGYGIYDRIDLCLDEIKNAYLQDFTGEAKHKNQLWNVICEDKEWFLLFGEGKDGFKKFY